MCHNPNCNYQKQITFTTKQYMLEGGSIQSKLQNTFKGTQTARNKFLEPAVNVAAPFIGMALSAKQRIQKSDKQRLIV